MKGLKTAFAVFACAAALACGSALAACGDEGGDVSCTVAMPDGAPALALAKLMVDDMQFGGEVDYSVVNANAIGAQVSGEQADICILPVNAAVQLAGSGEKYKLLGTVTHGNLYMLSAKYPETQIIAQTLSSLAGKTVGCIQLSSFVGSVFKMILEANGVPYEVVESADAAVEDAVNLINIADPATGITPAAQFDYMIGAEPMVTAKTTAAPALKIVGDIQRLYGENGFPQAVMLVKNEVAENMPEFVSEFVSAVEANAEWIASDGAVMSDIVAAINANYGGATSSLNANNLNPTVISRCAIEFVPASECEEEIRDFIGAFCEVTGAELSVADGFFYE